MKVTQKTLGEITYDAWWARLAKSTEYPLWSEMIDAHKADWERAALVARAAMPVRLDLVAVREKLAEMEGLVDQIRRLMCGVGWR